MDYKRFVVSFSLMFFVSILASGCLLKKDSEQIVEQKQIEQNSSTQSVVKQPKMTPKPKFDLYSSTPYDLPLFSIVEISKISASLKKSIDDILESAQGFYLLRKCDNKIFIILQNPVMYSNTYSRHDLQFVEILDDGKIIYHNAGYTGIDGEIFTTENSKSESWTYDESNGLKRPISHTVYDENNKIKFVEYWNYNNEDPIKYQMKDSNKKTVSILKESHDNDINYRREHIFYDNDGNIKMSLTINYEEANISRITFFNSHELIDSISILTEYSDGLKTKELIYNEDYELLNTIVSEYFNTERKKIKVFDNNGMEISNLSS